MGSNWLENTKAGNYVATVMFAVGVGVTCALAAPFINIGSALGRVGLGILATSIVGLAGHWIVLRLDGRRQAARAAAGARVKTAEEMQQEIFQKQQVAAVIIGLVMALVGGACFLGLHQALLWAFDQPLGFSRVSVLVTIAGALTGLGTVPGLLRQFMALTVACPSCGEQIAPAASECPHCGNPFAAHGDGE